MQGYTRIRHGQRRGFLRSYAGSMGRTKSTDSQLREQVARRIKDARLAKSWSQAQLAEKIDVSVESISRYETGKLALSLELLVKMARVLGVPVELLVGDSPAGLSSEEAELVEGWRRLGARGRRVVLEMVRLACEPLENRRVG